MCIRVFSFTPAYAPFWFVNDVIIRRENTVTLIPEYERSLVRERIATGLVIDFRATDLYYFVSTSSLYLN
jgi:hypothetical protein